MAAYPRYLGANEVQPEGGHVGNGFPPSGAWGPGIGCDGFVGGPPTSRVTFMLASTGIQATLAVKNNVTKKINLAPALCMVIVPPSNPPHRGPLLSQSTMSFPEPRTFLTHS